MKYSKEMERPLNPDGTPSMMVKVKGYKEETTTLPADKKSKARAEIADKVFDLEDSVADNAKMISLLITLTSRMYDIMTEEQKAGLSAEDRGMIEYTFSKFATTNTRADVQFAEEGLTVVDKLLDRQAQVGDIVK